MQIRVLCFAQTRELTGAASLTMELAAGARLEDLSAALFALHPALRPVPLRYAVNQAFAPPDTALQPGDTVALIPPVAGG
jgi:molybdopterin converting factor subunit 1